MQDGDPAETAPEPAAPEVSDEELTPAADVGEGLGKLRETAQAFYDALPNILLGLGIVAAFVVLAFVIRFGVKRLNATRDRPYALALALGRLASGFTILVGILVAAVIVFPTFTPAKLLSFFGFGSVAIGFAFRDVLQNYLAGILLLFTQPFRIGDAIIFGEYEGVVQDIQTRATFVRTYDGRRVVIPNGELFTNSVIVNTAYETRRVEYDVGIGYEDDIELAKRILIDVMRDAPEVNDAPPPEVLVVELGPEAVKLRARWWIDPPQKRDLLDSMDAVLGEAKRRLTAAGVELPFPTQDVFIRDWPGKGGSGRQGGGRTDNEPPSASASA